MPGSGQGNVESSCESRSVAIVKVVQQGEHPRAQLPREHNRVAATRSRHPDDKGLYVSTGGFTQDARYEADRANVPVTLMGLDELVKAVIEYYEHMDAEARRLVPLRRVYWPIG